jgi:hypothetical protein
MSGKKRHKHQSIDLEELIATSQEKKAEQEILKLRLETDRLEFEKEREKLFMKGTKKGVYKFCQVKQISSVSSETITVGCNLRCCK